MTAPLGVLAALLTFREWLEDQDKAFLHLEYLPSVKTNWPYYAIGVLIYLLLVVLFVAPAANKARLDEQRKRHLKTFQRFRERAAQGTVVHVGIAADSNIVPRVETVDVYRDGDGNIIEGADSNKSRAIVLRCKNERQARPPRRIGDISNVSSQISYMAYGEAAPQLAAETGAWLSEQGDRVDFPVDATHRLVVTVLDGENETLQLSAVQKRGAALTKRVNETPLKGDLFRVRVRWYADSERDAIAESDLMLDLNAFGDNKPSLATYRSWRIGQVTKFSIEGYRYLRKYRDLGSVTDLDAMNHEQLELTISVENWQSKVAGFLELHYDEQSKSQFTGSVKIDAAIEAAGEIRERRWRAAFNATEPYAHLERQINALHNIMQRE